MRLPACIAALLITAGCASTVPPQSEPFPAVDWRYEDGMDPAYLLAPGDTVELTVVTAPELSGTAVVAPDGRLRFPLIEPVPAAARSPESVETLLREAYASQLRTPDLSLSVTEFASQQIFVGGAVAEPGIFDLPGQIDPLQAIIMAGGRTDEASRRDVFVMRRLPGGEVSTVVINLRDSLADPANTDWLALRRFDVVFVPRSGISNQNLFVQQYIRQALPIEFSLFYDVAGDNN